jgi:protein-S-isoprenylcysteine O-methyltransferase Ste14
MRQRDSSNVKPWSKMWAKQLFQLLAVVVIMDAFLFSLAGRLDWNGAWIFTFLYLVFLLMMFVWMMRNAPELLEERSRMTPSVKGWNKILVNASAITLIGLLIVAALDAGRFRWTVMPVALQLLGVLGLISCAVSLFWVTRTNPYLFRFARIQDDRDQHVVTTGPYRLVRHPMYAAMMLFGPCVALILGSWLALVPGAIMVVVFVIRTALEDRMLHDELRGYKEYAELVRYRLLPGVW